MIVTLTVSNMTVIADDPSFPNFDDESETVRIDVSHTNDRDRETTSRVSSVIQKGIDSARKALQNEKCAALFGDLSIEGFENPFELLDIYQNNDLTREGLSDPRGVKFESAGMGAMTTLAAGSFVNRVGATQSASVITINPKGFFYSGRLNDGRPVTTVRGSGFEGLNMDSIRGAVIIHELLHVTGRIPSDLPSELHDSGRQSMANAELVRKTCFA